MQQAQQRLERFVEYIKSQSRMLPPETYLGGSGMELPPYDYGLESYSGVVYNEQTILTIGTKYFDLGLEVRRVMYCALATGSAL